LDWESETEMVTHNQNVHKCLLIRFLWIFTASTIVTQKFNINIVQAFLPDRPFIHLPSTVNSISSVYPDSSVSSTQWNISIKSTNRVMSKLQLARRGNTGGGGGSKKRKNTNKKKTAKNSNTSKKNQEKNKSTETTHKNLPPWQVMSTKDINKNIVAEQERREGIRKGEIASSVTEASTDKKGDVGASSSLLTVTDRQLFAWKRFAPEKDAAGMKFEGAYLGKKLPPSMGVPEIAFLGRSNVGKSSLLNKLVKRVGDGGSLSSNTSTPGTDIARVGKTPGATASVNIYSIHSKTKNKLLMGLADLPGFGYAKLSKDVKESVEMAAETYLGRRRELALGILLVDVRRVPSDDDRAVLAALYDMGVPILCVATKVDKIRSINALQLALEEVRNGLGLPDGQPFYVSSVTGEGIKQLWNIILDACEDKVLDLREEVEGQSSRRSDGFDTDDTILLDDEGNWIEEDDPENEGLEWVKNFAYYDDSNANLNQKYQPSEESIMKMKENEAAQAAANEAMKLKNLRKRVKSQIKKGEI